METTTNFKESKKISYLALGDSYTIGESVEPQENFPYQLIDELQKNNVFVEKPVIIAKTGWTSSELQGAIKVAGLKGKFDMVTLLIGVNNQYRGESKEVYRKEFKELLQAAIAFAAKGKSQVFVVSIPDWSVTPFAYKSGRDTAQIAIEIDAFNAINKEETLALGLSYTDITEQSRLAQKDLLLTAADELHPSAKMYHYWAVNVAVQVLENIGNAGLTFR